jgi:peptidoglycan/xylan/chitin deacetylase (PgdA/CDA1 family)
VLTFDDGPWAPTTPKILQALKQECVRATFFLIGKRASEHPRLVRRIATDGHAIGTHTWSHRSLMRMSPSEGTDEIDRGIRAIEMALKENPASPFFRFPGSSRHPKPSICCNWASDWNAITPRRELELLSGRLLPVKALSCCTIRRPAPQLCYRPFCAIWAYRLLQVVPAAPDVDLTSA